EGAPAVACKFLPDPADPITRQEIRAVQLRGQLRHPHLVAVEQVWCYQNYMVATMPLAEGNLLDLLDAYQSEDGTAIPAEQVCTYLTQVARALDYLNAHQHLMDGRRVGLQHCDIKPSNLLLFGDTVKIADF